MIRGTRRQALRGAGVWLAVWGFWTGSSAAAEPPKAHTWQVSGVQREGLVAAPSAARSQPAPVIFAFHGHGGTARNAARSFAYHELWPEAIVVYLQGLPTPGKLTDPEGKRPGWQHDLGQQQDRDLQFFDEVFAWLKKEYRVDERRVFATGHSNGGSFTYTLWAARGDAFAAFAPSAAVPAREVRTKLKPKPVLHVAAENDPLVKYRWQELAINSLKQLNQCVGQPRGWGEHAQWHDSKVSAPLVTYVTDGDHKFPPDARPAIVKFFREVTAATSER